MKSRADASMTSGSASYDAQDITVLEGLEAVRKRPGMYIGSTGVMGLHHLVYELVDNSVDEALAGFCTELTVTIHPDNSVTESDNGRGIPVAMMEKERKTAVEVVLTVLHSGGKFGDGGGYKVSGGLHGVGVSVVNALSEQLHVEIRRDGHLFTQEYSRGAPLGPLEEGPKLAKGERTGTTITYLADADIFESLDYDFHTLEERLRETAFLTRGLKISIVDERGEGHSSEFQYQGGIEDFVGYLNENKDTVHRKVIFFAGESDEGAAEVAMQWNSSYQESVSLLRQQHQHARGGLTPERLPLGADAHAQQVRPRPRPAQGERGQPHRRGCPRGADGGRSRSSSATPSSRVRRRPSSATPGWRASSSRSSTRVSASSSRRTPARRGR